MGRTHELLSYDLRFRLRPQLNIRDDIVIIEVDDYTINNLSVWPLPRDFHASLIDVLKEYGAKMIAFDVLFSEPSFYDTAFMESLEAAGNVYLPLAFYIGKHQKNNYQPPLSNEILADIGEPFKEYLAGSGHINVFLDSDGKARSIPLFVRYQDSLVPQLALGIACDVLDLDAGKVGFKGNTVTIDGKLTLPVASQATFMVNYPGTWTRSFKRVSYLQILKAYADIQKGKTPQLDLSQFRDKICLVGLTATATYDIKPTPLEGDYPMLGLQASVLNSILTHQFIITASPFINGFINLCIFLFVIFLCLKSSPFKSLAASIATACLYFVLSLAVFIIWGLWINLFLPLVIIGLTYTGITLYKFIDEARKKQLLEKELDIARQIQQQFLPRAVEEFAGLKVASFMQPAKFVAGDLYDIIPLDESNLGVLIGDVSGKGVSASLIMAQTISLFRIFAKGSNNPAEVLTKLNAELCRVLQGRFVTLLYLIFDIRNKLLRIASAGHSPLIVYEAGTDTVGEFLPDSGLPLGVFEGAEYNSFQKDLHEGDKFLIYTDGISEARNRQGQEFGSDTLKQLLLEHKQEFPKVIADKVINTVYSFSKGCHQHDDISLILLGF